MPSLFWFIVHLMLLFGKWAAPFVLSWPWVLAIYTLVLLQFKFLGRCIVNKEHGLDDSGDHTFYADLLEKMGFRPNRPKVKRFARFWVFVILMVTALVWQLGLGMKPLWF